MDKTLKETGGWKMKKINQRCKVLGVLHGSSWAISPAHTQVDTVDGRNPAPVDDR